MDALIKAIATNMGTAQAANVIAFAILVHAISKQPGIDRDALIDDLLTGLHPDPNTEESISKTLAQFADVLKAIK